MKKFGNKKAKPQFSTTAFCMLHKDNKLKAFLAACVLPGVQLSIIFRIIPTIQVFKISLYNQTAIAKDEPTFAGLDNYIYLFHDEYFLMALKNTVILMIVVPVFTLGLGLLMAVIITQSKLKEKKFYRVIMFLPSIISTTVVGILWSFIYHPTMGIVNNFFELIGLDKLKHAWLGEPGTVLFAVIVVLVWINAGYYMVMYIAGIDGISPDIYEAATIDGASSVIQFFKITLPLLSNLIRVTWVLCLATVLNSSFVLVKVMTNGGPSGHSSVLLQYMYEQAFFNANFGYAMAIAVFTLALAFVLSMVSNKLAGEEG